MDTNVSTGCVCVCICVDPFGDADAASASASAPAPASTKGKGTKVDTEKLLDYVQPLLLKCYTPPKGPAHPMRAAVAAVLKKLLSNAQTAAGA